MPLGAFEVPRPAVPMFVSFRYFFVPMESELDLDGSAAVFLSGEDCVSISGGFSGGGTEVSVLKHTLGSLGLSKMHSGQQVDNFLRPLVCA